MINKVSKNDTRLRVHGRIRKRLLGSSERPRLSVYRSLNHIYAQIIDDLKGVTLMAASTLDAKGSKAARGNVAAAREVGRRLAEKAKAAGISEVVFDRGGYLYHGRVKALADAARESGLQF